MINNKGFCYEIFKNLSVWSSNGQVVYTPCCYSSNSFAETPVMDVHSAWQSGGRKKIIKLVQENHLVPGCDNCYSEESNNGKSRRQSAAELYEQFHNDTNLNLTGPQGLDYSVGNLCNLKCVICGPQSSSKWIEDYLAMYPDSDAKVHHFQKNNQLELTDDQSLANIVNLHIHGGGEPLLSDAHKRLLYRIKTVKGLSDVRVFYNTNGTVTVDDETLKLWEECKLIELYFSIDDLGDRFNYQRTGANFVDVCKNLQWFYSNMPHNHMFKVNTVWSYLNLYYLDELVDWHRSEFSESRFGDKISLLFQRALGYTRIEHVSDYVRASLLERFRNYPELTGIVSSLTLNSMNHSKFLSWIKRLDGIRNSDFSRVSPEWFRLLNDDMHR